MPVRCAEALAGLMQTLECAARPTARAAGRKAVCLLTVRGRAALTRERRSVADPAGLKMEDERPGLPSLCHTFWYL